LLRYIKNDHIFSFCITILLVILLFYKPILTFFESIDNIFFPTKFTLFRTGSHPSELRMRLFRINIEQPSCAKPVISHDDGKAR